MLTTENDTLSAVPGIRVGHWTDPSGCTGCTVILGPVEGMTASGLVLGGGPASRELALLDPARMVQRIDALVLTGGSAFGLAAADGVMRWLHAQGRGFETMGGRVPLVPAAAIFDLLVSTRGVRPDADSGRLAAAAASDAPVAQGRVGAGAGATAGSYLGLGRAVRTGLGSFATRFVTDSGNVAWVGALAVANPVGDIVDPDTGRVVAGHGLPAAEVAACIEGYVAQQNTTLIAVATDVPLTKGEAAGLAASAHAGLARGVRPSHTPFDGDTVFVVSTGTGPSVSTGALAVMVQETAVRAVVRAASAEGS